MDLKPTMKEGRGKGGRLRFKHERYDSDGVVCLGDRLVDRFGTEDGGGESAVLGEYGYYQSASSFDVDVIGYRFVVA